MSAGLPRTHARRAAVQALYQALVNEQELAQDELDFVTAENSDKMDLKYFTTLVKGVSKEISFIDSELSFAVDRAIASVDPVESSILRLAVYEFVYCPEVPYRVVLNEAVELAKTLGGEQGHKYVNGVLDKMGSKLRAVEYKSAKSKRSTK